MKQFTPLIPFLLLLIIPVALLGQADHTDHTMVEKTGEGLNIVVWFGFLELPFLFLCVYYSFQTAKALKGGIFGKGMTLLAWGFLVMAVGHIAMQVNHIFGYDIFRDTLGMFTGGILWFIALIITWGLSAIGFYKIYKVSKQG